MHHREINVIGHFRTGCYTKYICFGTTCPEEFHSKYPAAPRTGVLLESHHMLGIPPESAFRS